MSQDSGMFVNMMMSMLLRKVTVPGDFHNQVEAIKTMLGDDISGLVDSLTDFAVNSATVDFKVESDNPELSKILQKWLDDINMNYQGKIPVGMKALSEEYYKERWKYSSFPVLKIGEWGTIDGILVPTKMFFLDGGSIYAKDIDEKDNNLKLINYDYYLGSKLEKSQKLNKNVIFSRPYGRWFDKYPTPYLIKRGVYHNWKIIESIKKKEIEILDQIIPYLLLVKKGTEGLALNDKKVYSNQELEDVIQQFKNLMDEMKSTNSGDKNIKTPIRATQFDEEIKHLIPDLQAIFNTELFASAEKNILAGLGFIDIAEGITVSRRESVLNPKPFLEETKKGVEDFRKILDYLIKLIILKNKDTHRKYMNASFYITSSPIKGFTSDAFRQEMRLLWERGQLSNQTYCEIVGEVNYETEKYRRETEVRDGDEILMYPHQKQNREDTESFEEIKRQEEYHEEPTKEEDENGNPIPRDKIDDKDKYDIGAKEDLITAPYTKITDLPARIRKNMSSSLQKTFMKIFNNAYKQYGNETKAWRVTWSAIRKIAKKNDKGKWIRKVSRLTASKKEIIEE